MSFKAPTNFEALEGQPKKANGQCVRLLQAIIPRMSLTIKWKAGEKIKGNMSIPKGTAIATFFDGVYPNKLHGNHAAIYISQDSKGIWVIDQFVTSNPQRQYINKRRLDFGDPKSSNNGNLFYVIEEK